MTRQRRGSRLRARFAVVVAVGTALAGGVASPAMAASPETNSTTVVYTGASHYTGMVGGIFRGTPVTMHCWTDSNVWSHGTNRWFKISGIGYNPYTGRPNWVQGYASANQISNQARVDPC